MYRGHCACGAVTVELDGDPKWVANCHCQDCRKATGAALATYVGCDATRARLTGTPSSYESSPGVRRTFCGRCGNPIAYQSDRWPGEIHFFVGIFEHPEALAPRANVYMKEAVPWFEQLGGLPRFRTVPSDQGSDR